MSSAIELSPLGMDQDASSMLQDAIDYVSETHWDQDKPAILLNPGIYRVSDLQIGRKEGARVPDAHLLFRGIGSSPARLIYNGDGSVSIFDKWGFTNGATPWGGFEHILMDGYNPDAGEVAPTLVDLSKCQDAAGNPTGIGRVDRDFHFYRFHMRNAVVGIKVGGIVNFHMKSIWADGFGWSPIQVVGDSSSEGRPFSIEDWTYDVGLATGTVADAVRTAAGCSASTIGRGFLLIDDATGLIIDLVNGRYEGHGSLRDCPSGHIPCLIRANKGTGNACLIRIDGLGGAFRSDQGGTIIHAPDKRVGIEVNRSVALNVSSLYKDGEGTVIPYNYNQHARTPGNASWTQSPGAVGNVAVEVSQGVPGGWNHRDEDDIYVEVGIIKKARGPGISCQGARDFATGVDFVVDQDYFDVAATMLRYIDDNFVVRIPGAIPGSSHGVDLALVTTVDRNPDSPTYCRVTFDKPVTDAVTGVTVSNVPKIFDALWKSAKGSTIINPSIPAGQAPGIFTVSVPGAQMLWKAVPSISVAAPGGLDMAAEITGTDTVTVTIENNTGAIWAPGPITLSVVAFERD